MRQFIEHSRTAHLASHGMTRHIYINALSVDPAHQGQGIGAALVRWVEQQADAAGVSCWALSTPAAVGLYKRCGWAVREETGIDLDDWLLKEVGGRVGGGGMCIPVFCGCLSRERGFGTGKGRNETKLAQR
jgi:GNAT superfamily N-acetyltransferase